MQIQPSDFVIESLMYVPMGNYNPMPVRPYTFNVTQQAVDTIAGRLEETRAGKITPTILHGVTSSIVQPSGVAFDSTVTSSWLDTRRYLFMMKVKNYDYSGTEINTYLFGYTEYDGITYTGAIDLQMPHYINNIIETSVYTIPTPLGTQRVEKLYNVYNTLYSTNNDTLYTQRPVDIYQSMMATEMASTMEMPFNYSNTNSMITPFSNNVVSSTTENGITTEYLSKILTSGMHATKAKEIHVNSYQMGGDDPSEKFFVEPTVSENQFVRYISRVAGFKSVRPVFQFATLMALDNTIYDRFTVVNTTKDFTSPMAARTPDVGEHWQGQDPVTLKAHALIENAVALATKYGFTKLSFIATNKADPSGMVMVSILGFNSFMSLTDQDFNYLLEIYKEKFITEIFLNETDSGKLPLYMECHVDLFGPTKIYVEYAAFHGTWYTIPTFANSLYSSVLTLDQNSLDHSSFQLNNVLNTLLSAQTPYVY